MTGTSRATELEKLLMPGDLSRAHASIESECSLCHDRTDKPRQRQLCLGCHDHADVAADIAAGRGYHGRAAKSAQCNACHIEHKGRGADTVKLIPEAFDHARTDFLLDGGHVGVRCVDCHAAGRKYSQAPQECVACHRNDDVHQGKLGKDCAQCHGTAQFKSTRFDHAKTKFPLRGAHATVACFACHRDPGFKGAPGRCVDCHAGDDAHRGANGPDCAGCHGSDDWKRTRFDHAKASGYALLGKHASLACDSCHRGGDLKAPLPRECAGCHAATDVHAGRFAGACADCHAQDSWQVASFDHEKRAKYALRGAHATLDCHACHTGVLKQQQLAKECVGCHAVDDVHKGSLGRDCQRCHQETSWRDEVKLDHDLTRFPLVGLHAGVPCEECHATRAFREAPHECVSCHRARDVHKDQLGDDCGRCHNPNGWGYWQFDHTTMTKFPLTGAHERLGCRDCHREPEHASSTAGECASCHQADDVHEGQFGRDCGRCHGTQAFRRLQAH